MNHALMALAMAASAHPAPASVTIDDFAFKPASITIAAGQSVRFVNRDDEAHTVTASDHGFDSGGLDTGDSWTHRFERPGRYGYLCALHPYMRGVVIVLARRGHTP